MYELVSVMFPFAGDTYKQKPRPGFVISPPWGKHNQVVVAYVTTKLDERLETDILIDASKPYFEKTGLLHTSVVKLHRLGTFQPEALRLAAGELPTELIPQLKKSLMKIFQL